MGARLISGIEDSLLDLIRNVYDAISWPGVIVMMALETVIFLIPSEAVMTFAGWLLIKDKGHGVEWIPLAGVLGGIGSTIGSIFFYYVGVWGGRPILARYGRYVFISPDDVDKAEVFFNRWGNWAVFFGRMVPLVRSFISIPAGVARMNLWQFTVYTFAGSVIWATFLAWLGYKLGENWENIQSFFGPADFVVAGLLGAFVIWYIYKQVKQSWEVPKPSGPEA
ncbi:MAG TPA: DedA family protein [Dehalococcoidia bacterium]|nr:DedA family protein [Dehalococcoidia bacterium]